MKGMVFSSLQQFVEESYGLKAWDAALLACKLPSQGVYVSTKNYQDLELDVLVSYFSNANNIAKEELIRAFGRYVFVHLFNMAPEKAKTAVNLRAFLLMVHKIIHVEVNKLYKDSNLPHFSYREEGAVLTMLYRSPRKLCFFSEGLILGAAEHFQEEVIVHQSKCMHSGADHCQIEVEFHESIN